MNKLDFYLGRTVVFAMLLASLGFVGLFTVFTFLGQLSDIRNDYTLLTVAHYVSYSIPRMFYETLPYAALIGCLTGLGLLAGNSELIVMRSAGVSTWRIARAAMQPALALAIIGLLIGELLLPDFERKARLIREEAIEDDITPQGGYWYREANTYMHFSVVGHDGVLRNINQYVIADDGSLNRTLWADRASFKEDESLWRLENVIITELADQSGQSRQLDTLDWETRLTPELLNTEILVEPNRMSVLELDRKIDHMAAQGLDTSRLRLGYWTKLFQPLASLSLVLVAISFIFGPLGETTMGIRVVSGLIIGILFKFIQDLLAPASLVFGFPPLIAMAIPILICLIIGWFLLNRAN